MLIIYRLIYLICLKNKIRILSGTEEANLVARGLTANIPKANGIIADLGGGSLELVRVENGKKIEIY